MLLHDKKVSYVHLARHRGTRIWWNNETLQFTGVFLSKPKAESLEQSPWGVLKTGARHDMLKHFRSPSIHGLLGRFWKCCWRCRRPGSQVFQEQCNTGRHRDGMVCEGRIWQQFDCCHLCGRTSHSEARGSYLKEKKVVIYEYLFFFLQQPYKKREI